MNIEEITRIGASQLERITDMVEGPTYLMIKQEKHLTAAE
jgi:hypothetical protein